jgi:hypothetical protein
VKSKTVALRRPRGTSARTRLVITMHPSQLKALQERAERASMSFGAYVAALLESDAEDVPGAGRVRNPRINWLEDVPLGAILAPRCRVSCIAVGSADRLSRWKPCTLAEGHAGPHSAPTIVPLLDAVDAEGAP